MRTVSDLQQFARCETANYGLKSYSVADTTTSVLSYNLGHEQCTRPGDNGMPEASPSSDALAADSSFLSARSQKLRHWVLVHSTYDQSPIRQCLGENASRRRSCLFKGGPSVHAAPESWKQKCQEGELFGDRSTATSSS